jgi:hypothetical protein
VNTPRTIITVSISLLALSAVLGVLNTQRTRGLRAQVIQVAGARDATEHLRIAREKELTAREAAVAAANARFGEMRTKSGSNEAELINARKENDALQMKLHGSETEIAQLLKRIAEVEEKPAVGISPSLSPTADLQAQLEDTRRQLDAAEREKVLLSDKFKALQERSIKPEAEKKDRLPSGGNPGIRGTVLAVNQAYNFVVLNLGGRQGVEPNTEMLVLRGGSFIGKIRISSVEPATAIGDIITSSLARGVQVQTGDTVIYAGTNS